MTGPTDSTTVTVPVHVRTEHIQEKQLMPTSRVPHQPVSGSHCAEPEAAVSLWEAVSTFFMLTSQSLWCPLDVRTAVAFVAGAWKVAFLTECQPAAPRLRVPEQPKCAQLGVTDNGHHLLYVLVKLHLPPTEQHAVCAEIASVVAKWPLCVCPLCEWLSQRVPILWAASDRSKSNKECSCHKSS